MKRLVAAVLLVALTGCSTGASNIDSDGIGHNIAYSLATVPQRTEETLSDPVRRTHLVTQIGRLTSTASVAIGCFILVPPPFNLGVCPVVATLYNYGMFEFVLEPISRQLVKEGKPSLVGPYWEGSPRDGETFIHP